MSSVQTLWLSRSYGCPDLITVQILWLSRSYDCPDLMIVRYSCMLSFISYGCPDLMVVHILLLSTSYGLTLWLSGSYGYILWYLMVVRWHLMVVHVDGCPVDGCPLTFSLAGQAESLDSYFKGCLLLQAIWVTFCRCHVPFHGNDSSDGKTCIQKCSKENPLKFPRILSTRHTPAVLQINPEKQC